MTVTNKKKSLLLSLDDEWANGLREIYLFGMDQELSQWADKNQLEMALVATLKEAAARLEQAYKDQQPVALLLLDVMLNRETEDDLKSFKSNEELLRLDAGWKIASLLRRATSPAWVVHAAKASVLLLSSNAAAGAAMRAYGLPRSDALVVLDKALFEVGGKALPDALDKAFKCWKARESDNGRV